MDETLTKLQEIFRDELDDDSIVITQANIGDEVEAWDSLGKIRVVAAVEREFGIEFDADQIESVGSVSDILGVISSQ